MMYANPAVASGMMSSAIMNPGMVGGDVWRGYKSIDTTQPVYSEPTPTSAIWDGGEAMSPIARPEPAFSGWLARMAFAPTLLAAALFLSLGSASSNIKMTYTPDGKWYGQWKTKATCRAGSPISRSKAEELRNTCAREITTFKYDVADCGEGKKKWNIKIVCK